MEGGGGLGKSKKKRGWVPSRNSNKELNTLKKYGFPQRLPKSSLKQKVH